MTWAAVAAGTAAVVGGYMSSQAAGDASDTQAASGRAALDENRRQFNITQQNMAPFLASGQAANRKLSSLLGLKVNDDSSPATSKEYYDLNPQAYTDAWHRAGDKYNQYIDYDSPLFAQNLSDTIKDLNSQGIKLPDAQADPQFGSLTRNFQQSDLDSDPVYQNGLKFGLDQGTDAINARNMANGTGFDSGATLKQLSRYASDYGTTKAQQSYNDFVNNQNNLYSRMSGQASTGQAATANLGQLSAGNSAATGGLLTDIGNANAAGIVGGANAWGGAAGTIGGIGNNYTNQQMLRNLLTNQKAPGGGTYAANWDNIADNWGV